MTTNGTSIGNHNLSVFDDHRIVSYYEKLHFLFPIEEKILLDERISSMRVLDLGVGGGRTTRYFAPCAQEYWGLDISPGMSIFRAGMRALCCVTALSIFGQYQIQI